MPVFPLTSIMWKSSIKKLSNLLHTPIACQIQYSVLAEQMLRQIHIFGLIQQKLEKIMH